MITLSIDEKDKHVLRVSASYLLALAGDITTTITDDKGQRVDVETTVAVDGPPLTTFTAAELAEAKLLDGVPHVDDAYHTGGPFPGETVPTAAEVFARPQPIASDVPSIVDAAPLPNVPADTTAITSIPTPPGASVQPVPSVENAAAPVVAQTPAHAPGAELDSRGFPWDSRIHSRTKSKKANGEWKYARGVEAALITDVERELRALMSIPTPATNANAPTPLLAAVAVHSPAHTMTSPETVVPPPPPLQPAGTVSDPSAPTGNTVDTPPASIAPTASPSSDFPSLMKRVTEALAAGKLTEHQVLAACTAHKIQAIPALIQRPDLIPLVSEEIEKVIAAAGGL